MNAILSQAKDVAPDIVLFTADTAALSGTTKLMERMKESRFTIMTNVVSCGFSYEEADVFDVAYTCFEFSPNTPPLADMVQLCARVRRVKKKL